MANEKGTKGLQETAKISQLHPIPPKEIIQDFQHDDEVEAYHNDEWWEGCISGSLEDGRRIIYLRNTSEVYPDKELRRDVIGKPLKSCDFDEVSNNVKVKDIVDISVEVKEVADMSDTVEVEDGVDSQRPQRIRARLGRLQDYEVTGDNEVTLDGELVNFALLIDVELINYSEALNKDIYATQPLRFDESEMKKMVRVKASEIMSGDNVEFMLKPGTLVEVCSDEDGLKGVWFSATLVEPKAGWRFVVEYDSLLDDNYSDLLREEISLLQIRPRPPKTDDVDQFKFLDEVDAYYRDGWWVGVVSKVLGDSKYVVYFRSFNEEMEFQHSQLRLHQDWVDNKWVMASKV
ncbi:hypothetical protein KIW84_064179 [Lathyrus oleraceus]|uniref:Agenet domain-containing protein n=1 Tax=Pisum sativum TaxID=3888 RepID=A0A9D4WDN0_PEA|nr:hypothetical protein KIW84_064179 [Pisum sativum]